MVIETYSQHLIHSEAYLAPQIIDWQSPTMFGDDSAVGGEVQYTMNDLQHQYISVECIEDYSSQYQQRVANDEKNGWLVTSY